MSADLLEAAQTFLAENADRLMRKAFAEGLVQGRLEGEAEGRASERARIASIFKSPEAQGREHLALQLAYFTDKTADAAIAELAAVPRPSDQLAN